MKDVDHNGVAFFRNKIRCYGNSPKGLRFSDFHFGISFS